MRKNVKTYILVAVLALSCHAAAAQTALPFIRIDRNPVSSGMAAAGKASLSSPAWAAFGNSAVIPFAPGKVNAGLSYESWAPAGAKTSNIDAGVSFKAGEKFGLSLGFASGTGAAFTRTDDAGNITGEVSPKDLIVGGGFGLKFGGNFGAGANVRFASQSFDADKYSAVCADVFVLYRKDALGVSAGVSSLGTSVKGSSGEAYPLPASLPVMPWRPPWTSITSLQAGSQPHWACSTLITTWFSSVPAIITEAKAASFPRMHRSVQDSNISSPDSTSPGSQPTKSLAIRSALAWA